MQLLQPSGIVCADMCNCIPLPSSVAPGANAGPQTTPLLYYLYGPLTTRVDTSGLIGIRNSKDVINLVAQVTEVWDTFIVLDRRMPVTLSPRWRDVGVHRVTATGVEGQVRRSH